jgi:hypothetical protein
MPSIVIDPEIPPESLRQRLYSGDLVILTRLRALEQFTGYLTLPHATGRDSG